MERFTTHEMHVVQRWLRAQEKWAHDQRMQIECGDNYAMTNNKWPRVQELKVEEALIKQQQRYANEQMNAAQKLEEMTNEASTTE